MNHWFRLYNTLVDDPKVQQLPESLFKALINLWCVASQNDGVLPANTEIAYKLRVKPEKAAEIVTKLVRAGLIDNVDGAFVPHNWDGRQYKSKDAKSDEGSDPKGKYVYFVTTAASGSVKIGVSKNPWARITELQTGYPDKLSIAATFKTKAASEVDLHDLLAEFRRQGEWFDLPAGIMDVVNVAHTAKSDYAALMLLLRSELRKGIRSNDVATTRAEQTKSDSEQSTPDARALDETGLKQEGLLKATFLAECVGRPKAPDMSAIKIWLLDGISVGTISATVPAILRRKSDISSLAYCDAAVREAHAKAQAAPSLVPVPLTDTDWRSTVKRYKANRSQWSRHAGPEPGMAGCRCPIAIMVEAQIDPASGHDMTSSWHFIDHTTDEMAAFIHDAQTRKVRAPVILKFELDGVEKCGFFSQIAIPPGYDEATGERIAPPENEVSAA